MDEQQQDQRRCLKQRNISYVVCTVLMFWGTLAYLITGDPAHLFLYFFALSAPTATIACQWASKQFANQ